MTNRTAATVLSALLTACLCLAGFRTAPARAADLTEKLQRSVLHLKITNHPYDQYRPWKHQALTERSAYACAVGPYQCLTTAFNLTDVANIKASLYGRNDFIDAVVKVIDYESNLCLVELDADALTAPLVPLAFSSDYRQGVPVEFYWLSSAGRLERGRAHIDRARVYKSPLSYARMLNYVVANISMSAGSAELFLLDGQPIGLGCWYNKTDQQAGLIPAVTINQFLTDALDPPYSGFCALGVAARELLDPAAREFLNMPDGLDHGVYVTDIYNLGTGSDALEPQDVILAIDGHRIDAHGRFKHPLFDELPLTFLITSKTAGENLTFDLWRRGAAVQLQIPARSFPASDMLVPYYQYGQQPEYLILAGFVFQKLTRQQLAARGDDWPAKVSSHLYDYYLNHAFKPTPQRRDLIILSYVLPAQNNLGYHDLAQIVVSTVNGRAVASIKDFAQTLLLDPDARYHVIEFENDNPPVVIPRADLPDVDRAIAATYGITQLRHIAP